MQVNVVHPHKEKFPLDKLVFRNFSIAEFTSDTFNVLSMMYSADMAIANAATNGSIKDLRIPSLFSWPNLVNLVNGHETDTME